MRDAKGRFVKGAPGEYVVNLEKGWGWNKGIPRTEEQRRAHSEKMRGRPVWNKGKRTGQIVWNKGRKGLQVAWNKGKPNPRGRGPACHLWKGGITKLHQQIRGSLEYRNWRRAVFERDDYTCVWCGDSTSGNLEADHIQPFASHPELRFSVDNGRTLCKPCHKLTPSYLNKKIKSSIIVAEATTAS